MLPKKKLTKPTGYFLSTDCNRKNDMKKKTILGIPPAIVS